MNRIESAQGNQKLRRALPVELARLKLSIFVMEVW